MSTQDKTAFWIKIIPVGILLATLAWLSVDHMNLKADVIVDRNNIMHIRSYIEEAKIVNKEQTSLIGEIKESVIRIESKLK